MMEQPRLPQMRYEDRNGKMVRVNEDVSEEILETLRRIERLLIEWAIERARGPQ